MARVKSEAGVRVEGLAELKRALGALDKDLPKELRQANLEIAGDIAAKALNRALSVGGVAAKTAPSIRESAGQMSAAVSFGGPGYEFGAGAEFGGRGRSTTQQFQPHLGRQGYFVYPTIRENSDEIEQRWHKAADDLIKKHFPG